MQIGAQRLAHSCVRVIGLILILALGVCFPAWAAEDGATAAPTPSSETELAEARSDQAPGAPTPPANAPMPFDVAAKAAVLLDAHTGQVLYAKNPTERIAPASLTKIMTMLLALEAVDAGKVSLADTTRVSEKAWRLSLAAGRGVISGMYIEVGEEVSLEDLLYGVGVASGNDASVAIAEFLAGSEEVFVEHMNRRAEELGLPDTRFADSHGLSPDAYTTAYDMARLAAYFVRSQPDGLKFANREEFTHNGIRQPNRNGLIGRDRRVTGLKTGHLGVAGYHLVATAEDGEMSLVAAVLGADSIQVREQVALQLLDYGFRNFRTISPAWGEGGRKAIRVYKGASDQVRVGPATRIVVTVPAEAQRVTLEEDLPPYLEAPVARGEQVGKLRLKVGDETLAEFDLVATEDVRRGSVFRVIIDSVRLFFTGLIGRFSGGR